MALKAQIQKLRKAEERLRAAEQAGRGVGILGLHFYECQDEEGRLRAYDPAIDDVEIKKRFPDLDLSAPYSGRQPRLICICRSEADDDHHHDFHEMTD